MSIGEMAQTIDFESNGITLILGENTDMIADAQSVARNGAGKSAIFNALSFALFGQALSTIKRDNLINNINNKAMFVVFEFECNGHSYRIERGRRPNFFRFFVDNTQTDAADVDESQGESKLTQVELEKVIGMSHNLFKHIIALNTVTDPFLKLGSKQQREFIEELLGMKLLSEKAENLKELLNVTKEEIRLEEVKIRTIQETNKKIEKNIEDLKKRSERWDNEHQEKLSNLTMAFDELSHIDIEQEISLQKTLTEFLTSETLLNRLNKEKRDTQRDLDRTNQFLDKNVANLETTLTNKCPTCNNDIHDETHEQIIEQVTKVIEADSLKVASLQEKINANNVLIEEHTLKLEGLGKKPNPFYNSLEEAYNHKSDLEVCINELETAKNTNNPFLDQIDNLEKSGIQEIDFENINDLVKMRDHQAFLLKLLTSNDSFIRKKIIDQNVAFLNDRLSKYLEKLALPHNVLFQSDLTVEITNFGRELDFGSLSRGEQTRLILGLSWSFRDIYELLTHQVNVVLVDELLDIGSDNQLVESAMGIIKKMHTERAKDVFVISHKDELVSKVPQVLKVVKEGGFSTFNFESDYVP